MAQHQHYLSLLLLALGALAEGTPPRFYRIGLETDAANPGSEWLYAGRSDAGEMLNMVFAVRQSAQGKGALEQMAMAVSDPDSPAYGQHLTLAQVNELVRPERESLEAVSAYLSSHGVRASHDCNATPNGDMFKCRVTVAQAEALLGARYHYFRHTKANVTVVRTLWYSLPDSLSKHVDFVAPTVRFPTIRGVQPMERRAGNDSDSGTRVNTPKSLRALYRVGDDVKGEYGRQACTAFLEQYYEQSDLDQFWQKYYEPAVGTQIKVIGPNPKKAGVEASLDIQYLSTLGFGVETEFWSFAGRAPDNPENEPFLDWMFNVSSTPDHIVPKVFSTSYGEAEKSVSMAYMTRLEVEFQKAAARGISLLFATGDYGVANSTAHCPGNRFVGQWPAGSAWVTGVGGTQDGDVDVPERAWTGSSGGFSDVWDRPSYQKEAVEGYFKLIGDELLPASKYYNHTGCGFPDVAAQGKGFKVLNAGELVDVDGTSASTPTFSGIVGLLNSLRIKKDKPTLGFLNPLLYKNPSAFFDITSGTNDAGNDCGPIGFTAAKGWDPVTGLGSPNYEKLAKVVEALP